ncbi:DMT family transporter [Streptacidiphilus sp. PB12-B1b]|uniref:DMT family transporter n=1 Tax=Streptacidiphilus sp. PB12-B1b TaxID=2705012 RepID=UPI0015F8C775|nr:DMT family transporter [Streptacidiphilus sp. PB12-B1b]
MRNKDSATDRIGIAESGVLLAALGVLCFSFSFPATDWALDGFGPWAVTGIRGLLAGLAALGCLAIGRVPLPERRHWRGLAVVAGGCVIGFPLLTTIALQTSSTAHTAVVTGALPLATAAVSAALTGARPPRRFWAAALTGAAVVIGFALAQNHGRPAPGDLCLFGALAVCAAGYAEGGRLAREMPGWQVIGWGVVLAMPVSALITASALATEPVHPTVRALTGVVYLAAGSQFGGFVVWYRGMALIGVVRASQLQLAQPLLTLAWSALLLGERLTPLVLGAASAVLGCIVVTQRTRVPEPVRSAPPLGDDDGGDGGDDDGGEGVAPAPAGLSQLVECGFRMVGVMARVARQDEAGRYRAGGAAPPR